MSSVNEIRDIIVAELVRQRDVNVPGTWVDYETYGPQEVMIDGVVNLTELAEAISAVQPLSPSV